MVRRFNNFKASVQAQIIGDRPTSGANLIEENRGKAKMWMGRGDPVAEELLRAPLPDNFNILPLTYDGTTDPEDHVFSYVGMMECYNCNSANLCRAFKTTLEGFALKWYYSLEEGSISSWRQLAKAFLDHYQCLCEPPLTCFQLLGVKQGPEESLRNYFHRFTAAKVKVFNFSDQGVTLAFVAGLRRDSPFRVSIMKRWPKDYPDLVSRARGYIRAEGEFESDPKVFQRQPRWKRRRRGGG